MVLPCYEWVPDLLDCNLDFLYTNNGECFWISFMCQIRSKIISHYSKITPYNISLSFFWRRHRGSERAEGLGPWRWWMGQWLRPHLRVWMQPHTWTAHRSFTKAYLVGWVLVWGIARRTASEGSIPPRPTMQPPTHFLLFFHSADEDSENQASHLTCVCQ